MAPFTQPDAFTTRPTLAGTFGMAASTHWLASERQAVLERGGNAFDAAVAGAFVLHVVEPHLNGPGGDLVAIVAPSGEEPQVLMGQGPAPAGAIRGTTGSRARARSRVRRPRRGDSGRGRCVAAAAPGPRHVGAGGCAGVRDRVCPRRASGRPGRRGRSAPLRNCSDGMADLCRAVARRRRRTRRRDPSCATRRLGAHPGAPDRAGAMPAHVRNGSTARAHAWAGAVVAEKAKSSSPALRRLVRRAPRRRDHRRRLRRVPRDLGRTDRRTVPRADGRESGSLVAGAGVPPDARHPRRFR